MYVTAQYGQPKLVLLSLLDAEDSPAGLTLENNPTLAAADVSLISDQQALTACAAEHVAFTSGSEAPKPGDTLSGATSSETLVVIGYILSGGTWAGGDAAGTLWVEQASGAFSSENLDNDTTGDSNVMTIGGDLTDSAIDAVGRTIGIGLTSTEMSCRQFNVEVRDATATEEYLETFFAGETIGHEDAAYNLSGAIHSDINDASATTGGFTTTRNVGSVTLYGIVELTDGALQGETRVAKWTGTTLTLLGDDDMDAAERLFSAAPDDNVNFTFYPTKSLAS